MKLEVAFDDVSTEKCLEIVEKCHKDIDIIEVGTVLVIKEGLHPLRKLRELYPEKTLLVDPKIMDAPEKIANACYEAGADIVTVMAAAGIKTVSRVCSAAKKYGKEVLVDLIGSKDPLADAVEIDKLGADYICVHFSEGPDRGSFEEFEKIKTNVSNVRLAAAGGINADSVSEFVKRAPDILIVGSGIYNAEDPAAAIKEIREKMI